jgi:hypothetical protein
MVLPVTSENFFAHLTVCSEEKRDSNATPCSSFSCENYYRGARRLWVTRLRWNLEEIWVVFYERVCQEKTSPRASFAHTFLWQPASTYPLMHRHNRAANFSYFPTSLSSSVAVCSEHNSPAASCGVYRSSQSACFRSKLRGMNPLEIQAHQGRAMMSTSVLFETSALSPSPTAFFGHPRWHSVATGTSGVPEFTQPADTRPRTIY